jgi:hypothetical protein
MSPEQKAEREQCRRRDVVADRAREPGTEGAPQLDEQRRRVPCDGQRDGASTCGSQPPLTSNHRHDHEHRAAVAEEQPHGTVAARRTRRRTVQQGVGEVLAPHQDGMGHRTEQQQVEQQPPGGSHITVHQRDHDDGGQPQHRREVAER